MGVKLEVGKEYVCRDGVTTKIVTEVEDPMGFNYVSDRPSRGSGDASTYKENGEYNLPGIFDLFDIVCENVQPTGTYPFFTITTNGQISWPNNAVLPVSHTAAIAACQHTFKTYICLNEKFKYCTKCDKKET